MLRKLLVPITALITLSLTPLHADELTGTLKKIADSKTITVGYRESSIPFSYLDEKQQAVGYSHDLMLKIVDALKAELNLPDLKVVSQPVTSQNRIPNVINGTIDIECGSTTNNAERRKQVDFSNTLFIASTRLITKTDSGIKDFPDLAGKNVVTTRGTTSETLLNKLNQGLKTKMTIVTGKEHGESFSQLETGRAVAFMMDDILLAGEQAKSKNPEAWIITGTPQSREAYACMMRKDDGPFKKRVDDTLANIMTTGEAEVLYKKWFQSPIPPKAMNLNYPLSEDMKALFNNPNDQSFD